MTGVWGCKGEGARDLEMGMKGPWGGVGLKTPEVCGRDGGTRVRGRDGGGQCGAGMGGPGFPGCGAGMGGWGSRV